MDGMILRPRLTQIIEDLSALFSAPPAPQGGNAIAAAGNHLEGVHAKEGVTPKVLATLDAFEQEMVGSSRGAAVDLGGELEEGGDRTQQVRHNRRINGDDVPQAREATELGEGRSHSRHGERIRKQKSLDPKWHSPRSFSATREVSLQAA